jgi:divalent metal cation (Fe/Co/Zn/Cd) transporter
MPSDSTRTVLVALGSGLAVALAKLGAAVFTGSAALAAEAAHSLADSGNDLRPSACSSSLRHSPCARASMS